MKKNILKLLFLAYVFTNGLLYAGNEVPPPPTTMARPGGGGGDTGTPGARASSPIDMYIFILAIIAILTIIYFAKRYKAQKA